MNRESILTNVVRIIKENVPELVNKELTPDTVVNTETSIDSLGFVLIICKIEAQYGFKLADRQWKRLSTLNDIVDEIEKRATIDV